jgi:branched-subunit amino acid ABC-type transport system permease component
MPGALLGGLIIGVIESLAGGYIGTSFLEVSAFVVIMVTLIFRPSGLLGSITVRRA